MLTQEEFMDVLALRGEGLTVTEVADRLGYHRTTISERLKAGGPPADLLHHRHDADGPGNRSRVA